MKRVEYLSYASPTPVRHLRFQLDPQQQQRRRRTHSLDEREHHDDASPQKVQSLTPRQQDVLQAQVVRAKLQQRYGHGASGSRSSSSSIRLDRSADDSSSVSTTTTTCCSFLTKPEKVLVMQGWNKILAHQSSFGEALLSHWRLLVALANPKGGSHTTSSLASSLASLASSSSLALAAYTQIEQDKDPLAMRLGDRLTMAPEMIMTLLDTAIRSLCPHTQRVAREAYRPLLGQHNNSNNNSNSIGWNRRDETTTSNYNNHDHHDDDNHLWTLECTTVPEYLALLARLGLEPHCWLSFVQSFAWACRTHAPYLQPDDLCDLDTTTGTTTTTATTLLLSFSQRRQGKSDSAFLRAVVHLVALPAVQAYIDVRSMADQVLYATQIPRFWKRYESATLGVGGAFYQKILNKYPHLMDYFAKTDLNAVAAHLMGTVGLLVQSVTDLGDATSTWRSNLNRLAAMHKRMGISTANYMLLGVCMLETLQPLFEREEEKTQCEEYPVSAQELFDGFLLLYKHVMSIVYAPMLMQERLLSEAREFYLQLKEELNWSDTFLQQRMVEIEDEVALRGTYTQTSQELEIGARLAWRNSSKCIGRISWNTLQVRDCRRVTRPEAMAKEVERHLQIAAGGSSIQSVMTVFAAKSPNETIGTRFWSDQYVRYAGYKNSGADDEGNPTILGDPANVELTDYLIEEGYWDPPETRSAFDILPIVIKVPGREKPFVHTLPRNRTYEIPIEHPTMPEITKLGFRWTAVPALSNFKMILGGVVYQNIPFNGWFVSTEIVRNLMERYNAGPPIAKALGIDTSKYEGWRPRVVCELEVAVLHSFRKLHYTIVDPQSAGESFCTHVKRERERGRECPAQWSWIGGFTGPTNPTWHLEMRDFIVKPQYDYQMKCVSFYIALNDSDDTGTQPTAEVETSATSSLSSDPDAPKVLILYGSETGTAEAVARELKHNLRILDPELMSLNDAAGLNVVAKQQISHLLCITSTFGEGGAPWNATEFLKASISKDQALYTKYAVLALGSSLYPGFCKFGVDLDRFLNDAGFETLFGLATADEIGGGVRTRTEWLDLVKRNILPPDLEEKLRPHGEDQTHSIVYSMDWSTSVQVESDNVDEGSLCLENVIMTDRTRKITFALPHECSYRTGDHLVVYPVNSIERINAFLGCFSEEIMSTSKVQFPSADRDCDVVSQTEAFPGAERDGDDVSLDESNASAERDRDGISLDEAIENILEKPFSINVEEGLVSKRADVFFPLPATLRRILSSHVDLALNEGNCVTFVSFLKEKLESLLYLLDDSSLENVLRDPCVDEFFTLERNLAEGGCSVNDLIDTYPSLSDLFNNFRSVFFEHFAESALGVGGVGPLVSLAEVLVLATRLQPRYYSISSSHRVAPTKVTITVGILKKQTAGGIAVDGVCSHYLGGLSPGIDKARIAIRNSNFHPPSNPQCPLILVGCGTGLSPLMGFLRDRELDRQSGKDVGPTHLFFGFRDEDNFIYESELRRYERSGLLKLHLAISRSKMGLPKTHVQNKLEVMGWELARLLRQPMAHYFICGDAQMANECHEACLQLIRKYCRVSRVSAAQTLNKMRSEGRWQTDVWGFVSHYEEATRKENERRKEAAKVWRQTFDGYEYTASPVPRSPHPTVLTLSTLSSGSGESKNLALWLPAKPSSSVGRKQQTVSTTSEFVGIPPLPFASQSKW